MLDNFRQFQAGPDPFGRTWQVHFNWLQNGISIRHADTVDIMFAVSSGAEPFDERIVALPHPALLAVSKNVGHALTDAWCLKIGALHVQHMLETGEDLEKTLVTVQHQEIEQYARQLQGAPLAAK
jgi:hypothetical protein